MPQDPIAIIGLEDVKASLLGLPWEIVRDLFPDALAAAGAVIEDELTARTPEGPDSTSSKKYGHMKDDIATAVTVDEGRLEGSAKVGFGKTGYKALFEEFGHRETTHAGRVVGFTPANPFMRQSAEASQAAAVDAFVESLGEKL